MKRAVITAAAVITLGLIGLEFGTSAAKDLSVEERFGPAAELVAPASGTYEFDINHSAIGFKVLHMGLVYVPGYFNDFSGSVNYDEDDVTKSSVEFTAKTESVDTRVEARNKHLRTADFFDVEKHPTMTFKSTKVIAAQDVLMVTGDFTLRGTTKSITIPVKVAGFKVGRDGTVTMGAIAATSIMRSEYGVNYGLNGAVSDKVDIELNIEAKMKKEEK